MSFAAAVGMGVHIATIEMRTPEVNRERLHELVKEARTVMVLTPGWGSGPVTANAVPMVLARAADDTTMFVVTVLDAAQVEAIERRPVTVVVSGREYALFSAEASVSRDRGLIDALWSEGWRRWCRGKSDPAIAVVVLSPIEGSYWEGSDQHSYVYKLLPRGVSREAESGRMSLDR